MDIAGFYRLQQIEVQQKNRQRLVVFWVQQGTKDDWCFMCTNCKGCDIALWPQLRFA